MTYTYIHLLIFPTGFFKELYDWLQDHKKIKIDYKTTRRSKLTTRLQEEQIDQGGVLQSKIGLVINFHIY